MVMKKYPKTDKEKQGCLEEMARMQFLRDHYKMRLQESLKEVERKLE